MPKKLRERRSFAQIRNLIIQSLSKRPMSLWELTIDSDVNLKTAKEHLSYLQQIGVVRRTVFNVRKQNEIVDKPLWELIGKKEIL